MKCPNCYNDIRDNAKFCSFCGHKIVAAPPPPLQQPSPAPSKPTEIVRPRAADLPPPIAPQRPAPVQPPPFQAPRGASPYATPAPAPAVARRTPRWLLPVAGLAAVVLLGLAALWFFVLRGGGGSAPAPAGERVLFSVTEDSESLVVAESLMTMARDGSEEQELVFDRDGIWVGYDYANPYAGVAPNGRWLSASRFDEEGFELTLVPTDGGAELHSDANTILDGQFAPDSSAFAYTRLAEGEDGDEITLIVVDREGAIMGEWLDLVFVDFFSDGRILAVQTDDEGLFTRLVTLELPDGQPATVVELGDSTGDIAPFVHDDKVYYFDDDELVRLQANGEGRETVYRAESDAPLVFTPPGADTLLVLEREDDADRGDLYAVAPDGSDRVRLGEDVYLDPGDGGSVGQAVAAAGNRVAYATSDSDGLSLYIINADGSERRRLIDEQGWLVFVFAPGGDELAYIAGESAELPGDLFVAQMPDGDVTRLARDAWSFLFAGNRLLYSSLEDAGGVSPESTIHRITTAGEEDEVIYGPQDGFIRFLSPVR